MSTTTTAPGATGTDGRKLSTYHRWLADNGAAVLRTAAVPSLLAVELDAGDEGIGSLHIELDGMQGLSSLEVIELPPGSSTPVTHHLYEEYVLALTGQGTVEFTSASGDRATHPWTPESVFAVPLNMRYRLTNTSGVPARLVRINNAALMMDLIGDAAAVFDSDLVFPGREAKVLDPSRTGELRQVGRRTAFDGPVFHDLGTRSLPEHEFIRGPGFGYLLLNLASGVFGSHVGELPPEHISNAHWHMGGAVLISVAGEGYTLSWPSAAGLQPPADAIVRDDFDYSGAVSVGIGWFHLHANTGTGPLRQVAFRYGGGAGATFSTVQGVEYAPGRVVNREDLAPAILREYRDELARRGGRVPA